MFPAVPPSGPPASDRSPIRRRSPFRSAPRLLPLLLAVVVLLADQISKEWVLNHLIPGRLEPFLPGLLALQRVRNDGAAFSLFSGATPLLGVVSLLVSVGVLAWILRRPPQSLRLALGAGFLLGGALGNGLDRWRHGAVTDFLALVPISFPVFNLADVAINLAVACFVLDQLLPLLSQRRSGDAGEDPGSPGHG